MGRSHITITHNYQSIIMFGKLSQIRNFIANAITTLQSQKPVLPTDPALDRKLKFMLDYVLKNPHGSQFKAYHQLQGPQMNLNQLLSQIYCSCQADTQQITSILHFYTFLLVNCSNELVLCKLVSNSFVLELTEVYSDRLNSTNNNTSVDIEEINSYKIALIKAYVSKLDHQTIKYMIINDRMRIFQNCVMIYQSFIQLQQKQEQAFGVEATCIGNCILIIIHFLTKSQQYSVNICYQEGEKGIAYLLTIMVKRLHSSILDTLHSKELQDDHLEMLESKILFLVDMVQSITQPDYRKRVIQDTSKELQDLRQLFKEIVAQYILTNNLTGSNYVKSLELVRVLLKLLAIYFQSSNLTGIYEEYLPQMLDQFIITIKASLQQVGRQKLQNQMHSQVVYRKKTGIVNMFCINMDIMNIILDSGGFFVRKKDSALSKKQAKTTIVIRIVDIIQILLSQTAAEIQQILCVKGIKLLMLALMQLTLDNQHTLHQYSVLKLHQNCILHLKKLLKRTDDWGFVVLNYESLMKSMSHQLLNKDSNQTQEYAFCQFHDPQKCRVPSSQEQMSNAISIQECLRNFRFMIVEKTYVSLNNIKLQKTYHTNFISPGWHYEPGKEIDEEAVEICSLLHIANGIKIPITVIQDQECLIFAHLEQGKRKVIANIRFKMIEGFTVEKDVIHILLKGAQQVLVEGPHKHTKENIGKFKEELIQKRDRTRQRELKFIHHYLDLYYQDNFRIIQQIGEQQIQDDENSGSSPPKNQQISGAPTNQNSQENTADEKVTLESLQIEELV